MESAAACDNDGVASFQTASAASVVRRAQQTTVALYKTGSRYGFDIVRQSLRELPRGAVIQEVFANDSKLGRKDTDLCRDIVRRLGVDLANRLMQAVVVRGKRMQTLKRQQSVSVEQLNQSVLSTLRKARIEDLCELLELTRWARRLRCIGLVAGARLGSKDGGSDALLPDQAARTKTFLRHCVACSIPVKGSVAAETMGGAGSLTQCPVKGVPCTFIRKALAVTNTWKRFNLQVPAGARARAVDLTPEMGRVRVAMASGDAAASKPLELLRKIVEAALQRSVGSLQSDEAALQHMVARRGATLGGSTDGKRARRVLAAVSGEAEAEANGASAYEAKRRRPGDARASDDAGASSAGTSTTQTRGMVDSSIIPSLTPLASAQFSLCRCHQILMPPAHTGHMSDMSIVAALTRPEVTIPKYRPPSLAANTAAFSLLQSHCIAAQPLALDSQKQVLNAPTTHPGVPL